MKITRKLITLLGVLACVLFISYTVFTLLLEREVSSMLLGSFFCIFLAYKYGDFEKTQDFYQMESGKTVSLQSKAVLGPVEFQGEVLFLLENSDLIIMNKEGEQRTVREEKKVEPMPFRCSSHGFAYWCKDGIRFRSWDLKEQRFLELGSCGLSLLQMVGEGFIAGTTDERFLFLPSMSGKLHVEKVNGVPIAMDQKRAILGTSSGILYDLSEENTLKKIREYQGEVLGFAFLSQSEWLVFDFEARVFYEKRSGERKLIAHYHRDFGYPMEIESNPGTCVFVSRNKVLCRVDCTGEITSLYKFDQAPTWFRKFGDSVVYYFEGKRSLLFSLFLPDGNTFELANDGFFRPLGIHDHFFDFAFDQEWFSLDLKNGTLTQREGEAPDQLLYYKDSTLIFQDGVWLDKNHEKLPDCPLRVRDENYEYQQYGVLPVVSVS